MLRSAVVVTTLGFLALAACGHSGYAVRSVPSIAADNVGKPVSRLQEAFGEPDGGFMGESGEDHVFKPEGLLVYLFGDIGMAMAVDIDPPTADRVDIGLTLFIE